MDQHVNIFGNNQQKKAAAKEHNNRAKAKAEQREFDRRAKRLQNIKS